MGILVHGIIYGLFYVGGQVYTDHKAPKKLKAQAQGFLAFTLLGVGLFLWIFLNGWLIEYYSSDVGGKTICNWNLIFAVTSLLSVIILSLFILLFYSETKKKF